MLDYAYPIRLIAFQPFLRIPRRNSNGQNRGKCPQSNERCNGMTCDQVMLCPCETSDE